MTRPKTHLRVVMIACSEYEVDARVRRAANALVDRGHQVDLLCLGKRGTHRGPEGLEISRLGLSRLRTLPARSVLQYGLFFLFALTWTSARSLVRRYDVVYVHNMPNFLVFAGLLPKLLGAKVVLDVHDPVPELVATVCNGQVPSTMLSIARFEERVSVSFSDALITVNEPMRVRLMGAARKELPVSVVMNLPDPTLFPAGDLVPAVDSHDPWLVYSGTVTLRHGVDLAIQAFGMLAARHPTLKLRIVGTGAGLQPAVDQVQRLDLVDRVEFLGMVPLEEIRDVVAGATGALAPHRDDEFGSLVFSVKVAECLALGLPVVCARTAGMRHYYAEDELFFFTPGDVDDLARSIDELLGDPVAARERAQRGKQKVALLDWSAQTAAVAEAVESVCQER